MKKSLRIVLYAGVVIALLAGVLAFTLNSQAGAEVQLAGTRWTLATIGGKPAVPGATLEFSSDTQLGGAASCNSYGATYQVAGNELTLSQIMRTLMMCTDDELNNQETAFMLALESARQYAVQNGQLVLMDEAGQQLLAFNPA